LAVANLTLLVMPLTAESVTVKMSCESVPAAPSSFDTSPIVTEGTGSSLMIVATPCASASVAFVGVVRFTEKVSSSSNSASATVEIEIALAVSPGANVSPPVVRM
jgi:hypothetical protein